MELSEVCKNAATNLVHARTILSKEIGDDLGCSVMVLIGEAVKKMSAEGAGTLPSQRRLRPTPRVAP